jgi:hypothetical protein
VDKFGWAFDPIYDGYDAAPVPEAPSADDEDPEPSDSDLRMAGLHRRRSGR